jgi:DNA-binding transcriptional MerR regulator
MKDAYVRRLDAALRELESDMKSIDAGEKKEKDPDARIKALMEEFDRKHSALDKKIKDLEKSGGSSWKEQSEEMDRELDDLTRTYKKARSGLK